MAERHPVIDYYRLVEEFGDGLIADALRASHGSVAQAARYLMLNRPTLVAMIARKPHLLDLVDRTRVQASTPGRK